MITLHFKCPGKALLQGGYAILEPPASGLVLALGAYFYAAVTALPRVSASPPLTSLHVISPQICQGWSFLLQKEQAVRTQGQANPFLQAVAGVMNQEHGELYRTRFEQIRLQLLFERPFISQVSEAGLMRKDMAYYWPGYAKTGLGSSACVVVLATAALASLAGQTCKARLLQRCRHINHKAQGIGSAFDISSAIYGSQVFVNDGKPPGPFELPTEQLVLSLISNDQSANSRTMSRQVQRFLSSSPQFKHHFLAKNQEINKNLRTGLKQLDKQMLRRTNLEHIGLLRRLSTESGVEVLSQQQEDWLRSQLDHEQVHYAIAPGAGGPDAMVVLARQGYNYPGATRLLIDCKGLTQITK